MKIHLPATSIDRYPTRNAVRMTLALLLIVLLVSPDLALAQEPASSCTTGTWTTISSSTVTLAPPGSPSYYGVETFASAVATVASTNTTYLYAIGGMDCNTSSSTYNCNSATFQTQVGHATLNRGTGALGSFSWQNLWSLSGETQPVGLGRDLCGVIYTSPAGKNYLYTVGGLAYDPVAKTSALTNEVWYAQIYPNNGSLLAWHEAMTAGGVPIVLPNALDLEGIAVLNGYLYVIGGSTNNSNPPAGLTDEVWSAQLNPNSGNLMGTAFTSQPAILPPPAGANYTGGIYKTCPVVDTATNTIYVAGGETGNGTSDPLTGTVEYAVQGSGGSLTDGMGNQKWGTATSLPNGITLASQAVVYNTGIVLMGGQDAVGGTQDTDNVYLGTIDSNTVISWPGSLPALPLTGFIERNAGATSGNFIYSLGGEVTHNGTTSDSIAIYCLEL